MKKLQINPKIFSLFKKGEINKTQFLIICWKDATNSWPNGKMAKNNLNMTSENFYKNINQCKYIWEKEICK